MQGRISEWLWNGRNVNIMFVECKKNLTEYLWNARKIQHNVSEMKEPIQQNVYRIKGMATECSRDARNIDRMFL